MTECRICTETLPHKDPGTAEQCARDVERNAERLQAALIGAPVPLLREIERLREVERKSIRAREEQREACALHARCCRDEGLCATTTSRVRATPLDATPLADRIKVLEAELRRANDNYEREKNAHSATAASHAMLRERQQFLEGSADIGNLQDAHAKALARVVELEALFAATDEELGAAQTERAKEIERHMETTKRLEAAATFIESLRKWDRAVKANGGIGLADHMSAALTTTSGEAL